MAENVKSIAPLGGFPANSSWNLHHIAHAVRDLDQAIDVFTHRLGFHLISRERVEQFLTEVCFLKTGSSLFEIITPLPGNTSLDAFLKKRGDSLHHLCFEVPDVRKEQTNLESQGIQFIDQAPRPGSHGLLVTFLNPKSAAGVLVELCSVNSDPNLQIP